MPNHKATLWPVWVVLVLSAAAYYFAFFHEPNDIELGQPSPVVETTPIEEAITTEEAILYIQRGQEILDMGVEALRLHQTSDMASVLSEIYAEYTEIVIILCTVPGTDDACISARNSLKVAHKTISEQLGS